MANRDPLKWKLKLTAELAPGEYIECDVTAWERGEEVTLGSLGLSLEEGKTILAGIQSQMVAAQVELHGQARRSCAHCGRGLPKKGHYQSTFRSVFGNVPVRVQRVKACRGCGENPAAPPVHPQVLHRSGTPLPERQTGGTGTVRQSGRRLK
jgi:hypothetical protein